MDKEWIIKRYDDSCKKEWNDFVSSSCNGTFLFFREYMDYHAHRYDDHSIMIYRKGYLQALLPAHLINEVFFSHQGLTYGGFVVNREMTADDMMDIFNKVIEYLILNTAVLKWIYRSIPHIYSSYPCEGDLYALFRHNASLIERKISTVIPSDGAMEFSTLRMRKVHKAEKEGFIICKDNDFASFWNVLEENLKDRHEAKPIHSLEEMELLHERFPENILLYSVYSDKGKTMAGCVIYLSKNVAHVQYIGSSPVGREKGAVDFLFYYLTHKEFKEVKYFDMGTSVEDGGRVLNEGLIFQKEGFGGRAVVYDTYELPVKR